MLHDYRGAEVIDRGAEFSPCGLYRYSLWRTWDPEAMSLAFIMLNPSTADVETNDPTVERCEQRARRRGYGGLIVANIMAYRATDPSELYALDPEARGGPDTLPNADALAKVLVGDSRVIVGWGAHAPKLTKPEIVIEAAKDFDTPLYCLRKNADGSPGHPLYLPYSAKPMWWGGASEHMVIE